MAVGGRTDPRLVARRFGPGGSGRLVGVGIDCGLHNRDHAGIKA